MVQKKNGCPNDLGDVSVYALADFAGVPVEGHTMTPELKSTLSDDSVAWLRNNNPRPDRVDACFAVVDLDLLV